MLRKPKFFDSPSEARAAARLALNTAQVVCSVNDVFSRVDPDEGKWFAIIVLDTDSLSTLLQARNRLPDFRVIGELFPETHKMSRVLIRAQHVGNSKSIDYRALVRRNVAENEAVVGNPARPLRTQSPVTDVSLLDQALIRRQEADNGIGKTRSRF